MASQEHNDEKLTEKNASISDRAYSFIQENIITLYVFVGVILFVFVLLLVYVCRIQIKKCKTRACAFWNIKSGKRRYVIPRAPVILVLYTRSCISFSFQTISLKANECQKSSFRSR